MDHPFDLHSPEPDPADEAHSHPHDNNGSTTLSPAHAHHHNGDHQDNDDATEAVLASLRAVIGDDRHGQDGANTQSLNRPKSDSESGSSGGFLDPRLAGASSTTGNANANANTAGAPTSSNTNSTEPSNPFVHAIEKALTSLTQQITAGQGILDDLNSPGAIQNLAHNLKALGEGSKKQLETIKTLSSLVKASELGAEISSDFVSTIDPELSPLVLRSEYDALKTQYDALLASLPASKRGIHGPRKSRAAKLDVAGQGTSSAAPRSQGLQAGDGRFSQGDLGAQAGTLEGRKKRSIKLEHLVHKMANRRLGVEYLVNNFESKGSRDLPDPSSEPPKADESANGVDEFRPDFRGDINAADVKPFVEQVIDDVMEAWTSHNLHLEEPDVDRSRVEAAVHIYWTRLCKRYDEQLHRQRGEIHRDELSRRKQNTYRRQQSLLARRLAAFDSSPLASCKLRALYRTILTIDFAAPTQDSPDLTREYTEEEWNAYRKLACGSRANEAHEVIDQFWLSENVRSLLTILDLYSADMTARSRRKGRPKQPNPTFHLPPHLWDQSSLPTLRAKDANGLPISGAQGIVLFKFHVDEKVQQENAEWAKGLYDNPPIPEEDAAAPSLPEVMGMPMYAHLKPLVKAAREKANPAVLSKEEIEEINNRVITPEGAIEADQSILDPSSLGVGALDTSADGEYMTFAALSRLTEPTGSPSTPAGNAASASHIGVDTIGGNGLSISTPTHPGIHAHSTLSQHTLTQPFSLAASHPNVLPNLSGIVAHTPGPSPGSSMRARKFGKRNASEIPGGAAQPVPKKKREIVNLDGAGQGHGNDLTLGGAVANEGEGAFGGAGVTGELDADGEEECIRVDLESDLAFWETL
ncbi:hypothetical protein I316_02119 [Kwoniella heveanensis BCC8398]|uniref:Uncharacterized protein n=1 Tax=Kwoniella heveanensis BCC8398 TaxID=1296120 RepID=A0A1B9GYY9_9TREE|nr:hypothetical protein I316_02119 [Kwoniella heveanensis BCC8398]